MGQVGSRTLSSAWQSGQGAPSIRGTAWAGSGWPLEGQCRGKDKRWRPRGGGWVPGWPVLGVRRMQAGKAVISVYRCRCGGVRLGVGGLLAQSADWELQGQESHQGLGSGICNSFLLCEMGLEGRGTHPEGGPRTKHLGDVRDRP